MKPLPNLQNFFRKFPQIDLGEDYILRDMMLADKHAYLALMADPLVNEFLSDEDIPNTPEEAEAEIRFWSGLFYRKLSVFWGIAKKSTGELIGTIGFNSWSVYNRRTEISYDLMPKYWRQGITSKALVATINFAFNEMGIERLEARTMPLNIPSQKILDKFGFKLEGTLRNYRVIRGAPVDVMLYSLVPADINNFDWRTDK